MSKMNMLKKYYPKEVELKDASNELAKEYADRSDDTIIYNNDHPLIINEDLKVIQIGTVNDIYDDGYIESQYGVRKVRILFDNHSDEETSLEKLRSVDRTQREPYVIDISTRLSLNELESALSECDTEEQINELDE